MRVDIVSVLSSISAFLTNLKEFKLHTVYFGTSEQIKPLEPVGQAAEFKFESKFEPLLVNGNHSRMLFQKTVEGFDCKISG